MILVVVKDRTQKLVICKVVVAKSRYIMDLILLESIVINLISGIFSLEIMEISINVLRWMNHYLIPVMEQYNILRFEFQFSMIVSALVVLMLPGSLVGIIPVKRYFTLN